VKVMADWSNTLKVTFGVVGSEPQSIAGVEPAGTIPVKVNVPVPVLPAPLPMDVPMGELVWTDGLLLSPFWGEM
jgi:hypothetical protein